MTFSNSSWDRESSKRLVSPAFVLNPPRVEFEFSNRRSTKIFQHVLGSVEFTSTGINPPRDSLINKSYGQRSLGGYKFPSISHTHILPSLLNSEIEIFAHGVPVKAGWENCAMSGMTCSEGESNTKCEAGKCVIGRLTKEGDGNKWRYESYSVPDLYYYVYGVESVDLLSVMRGLFPLPGDNGVVEVHKPASISTTVYLPPNTYSRESFIRRVIRFFTNESVQDSVNIFLREVMGSDIQATLPAEKRTYDRVQKAVTESLPGVWSEFVSAALDEIWANRMTLTNRDFLVTVYESLGQLYTKGVQVAMSSLRVSDLQSDSDISRPVYNRLPGISGGYNNDDPGSDVSAWVVSGADMELSDSKTRLDHFYDNFLDPETCYPLNLDWIAQHLGFFGGMWDLTWDTSVKRILIANAHKNELPESGLWTRDPGMDTLRSLDLSRIEELDGTDTVVRYSKKVYNPDAEIVEVEDVPELVVDISNWPGLIPARGSLVSLIFMFWVFGIKAISGEEMIQDEDGSYRVRSGLRRAEFTAPVNVPIVTDVIHVGTEEDAEVGVYPNQLIADVSACQDVNLANTVVVRMPFYYNRDGRTWDAARNIVENWMSGTAAKRLQYGYAAADLLVAEDVLYTL
jgi:hypothetical protein